MNESSGGKQRLIFIALIVLGIVVFWLEYSLSPKRSAGSFLVGAFYFLALCLGALAFISMQYLSKAGWPTVFRRVPEAMAAYLPIGAMLMALLYFVMHSLYHWSGGTAHDGILQQKSGYLNTPAFFARMAVYLLVWFWFSVMIVRNSRAQDVDGAVVHTRRNVILSALYLVVFCVTFTFASVDWIMSLEPHWYSTIFPWYVMGGVFVHAVAVMTFLLVMLRKKGLFAGVNSHHLHDLGKYLFAFSVFWGYLWFSQYLLIWYSNIPEEVVYYVARTQNGWGFYFYFNVVLNLAVPFCFLLPARLKQNENALLFVSGALIIGHWLDIYVMVMPSVADRGPEIGLADAGVFVALGSLFLLMFLRSFRRTQELPARDPYLEESLHHHVS